MGLEICKTMVRGGRSKLKLFAFYLGAFKAPLAVIDGFQLKYSACGAHIWTQTPGSYTYSFFDGGLIFRVFGILVLVCPCVVALPVIPEQRRGLVKYYILNFTCILRTTSLNFPRHDLPASPSPPHPQPSHAGSATALPPPAALFSSLRLSLLFLLRVCFQ